MSHEYVDRRLHFKCDEPGCHKNYECEPGEFRAGWREAQAHGWINYQTFEKSISTWRNACPEHAKIYG